MSQLFKCDVKFNLLPNCWLFSLVLISFVFVIAHKLLISVVNSVWNASNSVLTLLLSDVSSSGIIFEKFESTDWE